MWSAYNCEERHLLEEGERQKEEQVDSARSMRHWAKKKYALVMFEAEL